METFSTRNIEHLISYPFQDPEWKRKLLILGLVILAGFIIPILPWIATLGYLAQIIRTAASQRSLPASLPDWSSLEDMLKDGLRLFGVLFVYTIPVAVLFGVAYGAMFAGMLRDIRSSMYGMPNFSGSYLMGMFGFFIFFGLAFLLIYILYFFLPVVIAHTAVTRRFAAGFEVRAWWKIFRANWKGFLIAMLLVIGLAYAMAFVYQILIFTIVLICLTPFVLAGLSAYLSTITGVLFGAAYRDALEKIAPAEALPPIQ